MNEPVLGVEAQVGLAGLRVRPMALEAVVREDGPHVAREIDLGCRRGPSRGNQKREGDED